MPQMMPLNWLTLFSFFSITLMLFNLMNFYSSFNKSTFKNNNKTMLNKNLIWKW
uniref:ATP synthase complex subunit 8 n=1 Tax=Mantidae JZ-2017 TaxID=2073095 RepID=A0A343UMP7_9NEOP|nr:ATP synthase F0 subunit 8 [Mantidae JZ-2017]